MDKLLVPRLFFLSLPFIIIIIIFFQKSKKSKKKKYSYIQQLLDKMNYDISIAWNRGGFLFSFANFIMAKTYVRVLSPTVW